MVYIDFTGRLGQDAEVKTGKFNKFVSMNVATDVYNPATKENETEWFSVTITPRDEAEKYAARFKKGSLVHIHGEERVSLAISTKTNQPIIYRNVTAYSVNYVNSGQKKDANGQPIQIATTQQPQGYGYPQQPQPMAQPQQFPPQQPQYPPTGYGYPQQPQPMAQPQQFPPKQDVIVENVIGGQIERQVTLHQPQYQPEANMQGAYNNPYAGYSGDDDMPF